MRQSKVLGPLAAALLVLAAACGGPRASSVPLGGKHEEDAPPLRAAVVTASPSALQEAPAPTDAEEAAAEEVEIAAPAAASAKPAASEIKASAGAFQVRPYAVGQIWTRIVDLEFDVKLGPGGSMTMRMVSHQEARFEVLGASPSGLDKLGIEYVVDRSTLSVMGTEQKDPDVLQGKRYVVTYGQGKPDLRSAAGGVPPKKELDTVQDDAREPLEMAIALKELTGLAGQGKGDFSRAGAIALAGGEDDDTKITDAKASLKQLVSGSSGNARTALLDLSYKLNNSVGDDLSIEAELKGSLNVLDAPSRYQSVTLQGPLELRATQGGMEGTGTTKVTISYKY